MRIKEQMLELLMKRMGKKISDLKDHCDCGDGGIVDHIVDDLSDYYDELKNVLQILT